MDGVCRLCCSTKFVNNHIYNEENALYLKMSLYLPIKVARGDGLPQRVCDRCSCRVNDMYQFCNEAIEVQSRLRSIFLLSELNRDPNDVQQIKDDVDSPPAISHSERGTQTETFDDCLGKPVVEVKEETKPLVQVKTEDTTDYATYDDNMVGDIPSDNSEEMSLIHLKKKKKKSEKTNGMTESKQGKKRKKDLKEWDILLNALPPGTMVRPVRLRPSDAAPELGPGLPELSAHLLIKQEPSEDKYDCCICFAQCYSRGDMLQHYRQHGAEAEAPRPAPPAPPPPDARPLRCPRCSKVGPHVCCRQHGAEAEAPRPAPPAPPPPDARPLRCPRCSKVLEAGLWAAHWLRHWERDRRPYRCARCEKTFRDHHQILKHGLTHKAEEESAAGAGAGAAAGAGGAPGKRFVCDLCPEGFVYMRYLLAHRTRAHPEAAARALALRCAECAREFAHLNSLRRHLRAHSGERNFLCSVCGKALSSREHLKFHLRIHAGYKPNVCKTCGKGFVKKCNLTLHERVHSGEKPHVCSSCGKAFSQRSTLVIHERYHSGARPYVCGLCGRGFVAKGLLSMHLKTTCI